MTKIIKTVSNGHDEWVLDEESALKKLLTMKHKMISIDGVRIYPDKISKSDIQDKVVLVQRDAVVIN